MSNDGTDLEVPGSIRVRFKPGDKVTYISFNKREHGIIKSIRSDGGCAFVVYHCGEWGHYQDYTAAATEMEDLVPGWVEDSPDAIDRNAERNMHGIKRILGEGPGPHMVSEDRLRKVNWCGPVGVKEGE